LPVANTIFVEVDVVDVDVRARRLMLQSPQHSSIMTSEPSSSTNTIDAYDATLGYHPSIPPLDIRLGLTSPPSKTFVGSKTSKQQQPSTLRWGILGCSKVAHDFTQTLKFLSSHHLPHAISAVGSRSINRASDFAKLHNIPNAHGTYAALCADPTVDIIYVASLHPHHKAHAEMALWNGKHVLVEKPMTMKAEDAQYLYDLSTRLNLFVGEGMWTRFFPAVEWTRCHLGEDGGDNDAETTSSTEDNASVPIGQVRVVQADFSIDGNDVGPYPSDSLYATELGGGSAWCVMPYIMAAALMPFDSEPDRIAANGIVPNGDDAVGDLAMGMTLTFNNNNVGAEAENANSPPGNKSIASGVCGYLAESSEITSYAAKRGRITIDAPAHCPTSATMVRKSGGMGNGTTSETTIPDSGGTSTVIFPLPASTPEIEESGGIKLPNSMGFIYEAEAARRLIAAGQISFPQWTPEESVGCIRIIEEMLRQIGV